MIYNPIIMDERKLIEKCLLRDHTAWDEFTRRYYNLVLKCVRYKLKRLGIVYSLSPADDITQDIFLMLWETNRLSNIRNISSIEGWLAVVSINFTGSLARTKNFKNDQKTFSLDDHLDNKENLSLLSKNSFSPGQNPFSLSSHDVQTENNDIKNIVSREISKLVPKQALALKLNLLDGLAQKEIAALLKIPENTVSTLIRRGKSKLETRLKDLLK